MAAVATPDPTPPIRTFADVMRRLGGVPPERIRFPFHYGQATVDDVCEVAEKEQRLCELVEGILVEKPRGYTESLLAGHLLFLLKSYVSPRKLGHVTAPDGTLRLTPNLVRIPDIAFISWDRLPGRSRPTERFPQIVPDLAVEVLSESNTPGEMAVKRGEYFTAGVRLVWEIDPEARTVTVYTSPTQSTTLTAADTLDGGAVLPGFTLPLADLFAELDLHD
jgi:Uma2 family endonuclease